MTEITDIETQDAWDVVPDDSQVRKSLYKYMINKPSVIKDMIRGLAPADRRRLLGLLVNATQPVTA